MKTDELYDFILKVGADNHDNTVFYHDYAQSLLKKVSSAEELYTVLVDEVYNTTRQVAQGRRWGEARREQVIACKLYFDLISSPDVVPVKVKFDACATVSGELDRLTCYYNAYPSDNAALAKAWQAFWQRWSQDLTLPRMSRETMKLKADFLKAAQKYSNIQTFIESVSHFLRKVDKFVHLCRTHADIMSNDYFYCENYNYDCWAAVAQYIIAGVDKNPFKGRKES